VRSASKTLQKKAPQSNDKPAQPPAKMVGRQAAIQSNNPYLLDIAKGVQATGNHRNSNSNTGAPILQGGGQPAHPQQ
jgi:hypothetical protein